MVLSECGCEAGKGKRNHVIGLLHLLAHYQALGLKTVPTAISKTSLPQTWNIPSWSQGVNPVEVTIQKVKIPAGPTKRTDGLRSTLYNPIAEAVGDLSIVKNLRKGIKKFPLVQLHTVLPSSADITKVSCKFGEVSKGSMLSYQQRIKPSHSPKVHINIDAPDPPSFILPPVSQAYSSLTNSQQNFISMFYPCFFIRTKLANGTVGYTAHISFFSCIHEIDQMIPHHGWEFSQ